MPGCNCECTDEPKLWTITLKTLTPHSVRDPHYRNQNHGMNRRSTLFFPVIELDSIISALSLQDQNTKMQFDCIILTRFNCASLSAHYPVLYSQ